MHFCSCQWDEVSFSFPQIYKLQNHCIGGQVFILLSKYPFDLVLFFKIIFLCGFAIGSDYMLYLKVILIYNLKTCNTENCILIDCFLQCDNSFCYWYNDLPVLSIILETILHHQISSYSEMLMMKRHSSCCFNNYISLNIYSFKMCFCY